jgi:hypothetical protein
MYHPPASEPPLEWVELHNPMAVDVDMSGWKLGGGIQFKFNEGTVIRGGGYLVVAASPTDLMASSTATNVLGPFTGKLSNAGDKLELRNNNDRLMDEMTYGVEGDWPVGPDGSGVSLAKRDEEAASGPSRNWTISAAVGGTPGRVNFSETRYEIAFTTPLLMGGSWKCDASGNDLGVEWRQTDYDDSTWASGRALFQSGSVISPGGVSEQVPTLFSSGLDASGTVLAPGADDPHYLLTQSAQSVPPPPDIPATVIQNHPAWAANDADSSWIGSVNPGTENVAAGAYNFRTRFTLEGFDPDSAIALLKVGADNRLNDVLLNGVSKGINFVGFTSLSGPFVITNGFLPGTNTLDFLSFNDDASANPAGFRVQAIASARRQLASATFLATGRTNYYFRTRFSLNGAPKLAELGLYAVVADGAVFYLNGTEVLRLNMPAGLISASTLAVTNSPKPAYIGPFVLPNSALVTGTNVLAVELHRSAANDGVLFGADLSLTVTNLLSPPPMALAFNEFSSATNADFWVELINRGQTSLDLEGCILARLGGATNADYIFPAQTLAPGAFVQIAQAELGYTVDPGQRLILYGPGRFSVLDALVAKREPRGRWPDGTGLWWFPTDLTPGASNRFDLHDEVVINEIMYHAPLSPTPSATNGLSDSGEAWIELFNRSAHPVDMDGWKLSHDIDFSFPAGTTLPPGGFLVVAKDKASMESNYPGIHVVGPFANKLQHSGAHLLLLDPSGNPANELRFYDGKPWPEFADAGGSSLELRDPLADNSKPEAWAASDESGRSGWSNYTYRAVAKNVLGPTLWKEFVIGLLDAGECLIDDLSVVESPATAPAQMLQNGSFETGMAAWRALGDHNRSAVETEPGNPANHVLHLIATGPTEHMHNHLETTLAGGKSVVEGREYQVSFRAKWLTGNNRLNTRLYFNRVAKTTALAMPSLHGTPGAPNSTLTTNIGPTFANLAHSPVVPKQNESVTVSVRASDPQGVAAVTLWWSVNQGNWRSVPMPPGSPSTVPGSTNYAAVIPGQSAGALVQFFVQAADGLGALSTYPANGMKSRALFKVDEGKGLMKAVHRFRLLMTPADASLLHASTNVMSNDRIGLTVVYDERQVFYDAGVHLQSSERGRNESSRVGFSVKLPAGQLLRGVQTGFTIDRSGGYSGVGGRHDEILLWHAVNHAGGMPGIYCDLVQLFAPRAQEDSTGLLRLTAFDADYFDSQYKNGGDGNMYKLELIYYPTTTTTGNAQAPKQPQPDDVINMEIQNWGADKENYRWIFIQENHADQDDYSQLIALNQAFSLTGTALDTQTQRLMDVDEWMRVLAFKAFTGDGDTFTYGLNHNWEIYFRPEDGKALGLLWDMDFAFAQSVHYSAPGSGSPNTYKITKLPNNYRLFYSHLLDIMNTTVNDTYLRPWATHYSRLVGQNWSAAVTYLQQRANYLRSTMPLSTAFDITSNAGNDFVVATDHAILAGTAPLTVKYLEVNGVRLPANWSSLTSWTLNVPLVSITNLLVVKGVDSSGNYISRATDSITVIGKPVPKPVVINEWMADNSGPGGFADPASGLFPDWFELYNPNSAPVKLGGYFMTDTLAQPNKWPIPANTVIAANGFLLIWADNPTNTAGLDLHANFQLGKNGDAIGLFAPDGTPQHTVVFGPQFQNVSQGLFPDGDTNALFFMTNWTPHASNRLGLPTLLSIGEITLTPEGVIGFTVNVEPGRTYQVEHKNDAISSAWEPLGAARTATGTTMDVTDLVGNYRQRFYRVSRLP